MDFEHRFNHYLNLFNNYLENKLSQLDTSSPKEIRDVMSYAVLNGGKRVRPILCLATADMLNVSQEDALVFSLALEMVHAYSLAHDDLPAMDNDDFRRGKPSVHKAFGESLGILCGDALLNYAIEVCLEIENFNLRHKKAMQTLFNYSGYTGMIGGQVLDVLSENVKIEDLEFVFNIYKNKTAKLITAPLIIASHLSGEKYFNELKTYGYNIGLCFQIVDDIMDEEGTLESIGKTPKKDQKQGKNTSTSILGLDGAKNLAQELYLKSVNAIKNIPNNEFLISFANKLLLRKS